MEKANQSLNKQNSVIRILIKEADQRMYFQEEESERFWRRGIENQKYGT